MSWDDWRFFLLVARLGSLSAAAKELSVAQPTVGRRVTALEKRLGARLFARSPSGFTLTSAGAQALAFAERMDQDALGVERKLAGRDEGVRGEVRITASEWLVTSVLSPLVGPLLAENPQLRLELLSNPKHVNLARREADIALRPRRFEQQSIVQRAVGKLAFAVYAAHAYVRRQGAPTYGGGQGHVLISMSDDTGDAAREWLEAALPHAERSLKTNGRDAMLALVQSGVGLACLARVTGDAVPELQRLTLVPEAPTPTLWLGSHRDARATPRIRVVSRYLADRLQALSPRLCPQTTQ